MSIISRIFLKIRVALFGGPDHDIVFYTDDEYDIPHTPKEGANKQVISSQADSLIKISRIWADFFPANTSNQPI